jgi:hypothetical protein
MPETHDMTNDMTNEMTNDMTNDMTNEDKVWTVHLQARSW